jgi:tRNA threonylcarbamoyladenosine biosynthesis protein TsaE
VEAETATPDETEALAARLAGALRPGDVVTVAGDLGSGKTTFVRGACRALGVAEPVTSPTFTIGHRYDAPVPVAHLDLYRIAHLDPEEWGDLEPYFDGTIAFVEWPEHAGEWLPSVRARVRLEHVDETHRRVRIDGEDDVLLRHVAVGRGV